MKLSKALRQYRGHKGSLAVRLLLYGAAVFTIGLLLFLIAYILVKGIPNLTPELFAWKYTSENVSMLPSIINTLLMTVLALLVATPLGVFAAIYLAVFNGGMVISTALTPLGLSAFGFELIYGVWFMAATLAAYIIRKPGVALLTEILASVVELLMGNSGGLTVVLTGFIQGLGAVINLILDPMLIFGIGPFPRLEVVGAALATIIGQFAGMIVGLIMVRKNQVLVLHVRGFRPSMEVVREIYRIGLPSIFMQAIGSVMTFGMNKILIAFSSTATAVFGIYFKLQSFVFMPVFGLNNGMVPIVSYNFGAARPERVRRTVKLSVCTAIAIMAVGLLVFQLFPRTLLGFFNASADMMEIGSVALRIISVSFLFAGFCIIAGSVFQAIGNPLYSLVVSVGRQLVVLLPVAWLLSLTGRLELVWCAFPIAELMSLTLSIIFLRKTFRDADAYMAQRAADFARKDAEA